MRIELDTDWLYWAVGIVISFKEGDRGLVLAVGPFMVTLYTERKRGGF